MNSINKTICGYVQPSPMKVGIAGGILLVITALVVSILFFAHPSKAALLGAGCAGGGGVILLVGYAVFISKQGTLTSSKLPIDQVPMENFYKQSGKIATFKVCPQATQLLPVFYIGEGKTSHGKSFEDILNYTDEELETKRDYIQWLFPSSEEQSMNQNAPQLTPHVLSQLKENPIAKQRLEKAFNRMLSFYGLTFNESRTEIVKGVNWDNRNGKWLTYGNPLQAGITRILSFLCDMEFHSNAKYFLNQLEALRDQESGKIAPGTVMFWQGVLKQKNVR